MNFISTLKSKGLPVEQSLEAYALARSLLFKTESFIGPAVEIIVNRRLPKTIMTDPGLFKAARESMMALMKQDVANIAEGLYPIDVLKPGNPIKHLMRIPSLFREVFAISRRRGTKSAHRFSKQAQELLAGLPEYYQRNFHFQDDGYLSDKSAELYEHQVEILFAGSADAMRRMILAPMKKHFGVDHDGSGLTFLEIGAGTGRATRFVRLAFPKAKIVAVDLSAPYLRKAQQELSGFNHHDFVEANASDLSFKDETFDAVYSIFLFHELPRAERQAVIRESQRVLKAGGFHGLVDSLQLGDTPQFDEALELFPQNFHEPFYKNYIQNPIQTDLSEAGVTLTNVSNGFFSKCVSGQKSESLAKN
jgi:ubiquinone/menaquinone biosynthesis C-methylase UbiE